MKNILAVLRFGFEIVLDAVVPLRARSARTKARAAEDIPLSPTVHELLGTHITTLMDYRDPAVQDLIRALKYDSSRAGARLAAGLLADYLREEIAAHRTFSQRPVFIVPVPLHTSRARERGFNQIELVLRALPEEFCDGTLATLTLSALARTRATKPQTRLPRSARLSNVAGAFALSNGSAGAAQFAKSRVFLIDDVTTTGATLLNAAHPLRRTGADVVLIALARA